MSVRQFATAPKKGEIHPGYFKLKETQKSFQVSDGIHFISFRWTYFYQFILILFTAIRIIAGSFEAWNHW